MSEEGKVVNVMILVTTLLLVMIIGDNVNKALRGSASEMENYEKRKSYYEKIIVPKKLDLHPTKHYIKVE